MKTDSKITLDKSIEEVVYILDLNPCGGDITIDDILCYARTHFEGKPELIQSTLTLIKNKKTSFRRGWVPDSVQYMENRNWKKLSLHKLSKLRKREPYYWEPWQLILYVETEIDNCPDERLKSVARYALKKRHYQMMSESLIAMIHMYLTIFERELQRMLNPQK